MAEQLGEAELLITINDDAAVESLRKLKKQLGDIKSGTDIGTTDRSRAGKASSGMTATTTTQISQNIKAERTLQAERSASAAATLKAASAQLRANKESTAKRISGAISSGIIGGGFPLLFGQGAGAAIGGGIGGVGGGALGGGFGFGLSVVGTAIGAAFDEALNKGKALATGLQDPIGQFELLKQSSLLSSKSVEKQAQGLLAVGREAEAAALIQKDLQQSYGNVSELKTLTESYDQLARTFADLSIVTAKFVAGPLAEFLDRLRASLTLSPERQKQIENTATQLVAKQTGPAGIKGSGFFGAIELEFQGKSFKGSATGVRQDLITFLSRQALEAEKAVGATPASSFVDPAREAERTKLLRTQRSLIESQAGGYKKQALALQTSVSLQKEAFDIANLRARNATAPEIDQRRNAGELERLEYQKQLNALKREELAAETQLATKTQLATEKVQQQLKAVQAISALSENAQRTAQFAVQQSTLQNIQGIEGSVGDAQRRERELGAQISAARIRGGDAGEQEASRLVQEQKLAANQTRLELEAGALALTNAGIKLREDVEAAFLSLQRLRTGDGGLNQFLGGQDRANQERQTFESLLPSFRQAQEQFKQLRGVNYAPEFTGTTAGINKSILQFIDAVKTEQAAVDNSVDTQRALNVNTEKLAIVNSELAAKIGELNAKDWNVSISVASDGTSQVFGDAQNSALSVP